MEHHLHRDHATSNVLAWTAAHSANVEPSVEEDAGADADEPPDCRSPMSPMSPISSQFKRTPIRRLGEHHESLLTRALQSQSDEEANELGCLRQPRRRRSITSNTSIASTADFTCATGITTPARTNSPSPRLPNGAFVPLAVDANPDAQSAKDIAGRAPEKKRCISFACAARPRTDEKASATLPPKHPHDGVKTDVVPKKTALKFACPSKPARLANVLQREPRPRTPVPRGTPSTPKAAVHVENAQSPSTIRVPRSPTLRKSPASPVAASSKKWLSADTRDLESECARFHEFASGEPQEDDWIRRDDLSHRPKLTIDDTLKRENEIRKLGREAEEEAELEEEFDEEQDEEVDEADLIDEDGEDDSQDAADEDDFGEDADDGLEDDDDEGGEDVDDDDTEHAWNEDASDGYKTDNETGFAESDDEDDDLVLWTTRIGPYHSLSGAVLASRRMSQVEHSDSSTSSRHKSSRSSKKKRSETRGVSYRPDTPELPDSTDFVCGTLDEDKPLEEAYISCVEARRRDQHLPIPQDIDPSFPTSEPEDEAEDMYRKGHGDSDDHLWIHGELEDLHHERDRWGRKKKGSVPSPRRCRSPPPKRRTSPAPKPRGRSPRTLLGLRSPRLRSPAPSRMAFRSPLLSPVRDGQDMALKCLAFPPRMAQAKSLPRAPGMFPHLKTRKNRAGTVNRNAHVRGAIDIVMGLEQKRQRRKEKFYQKYSNRARKEKAQTRRPPPGQGAERMRELGLFMAGKAGPGNYVLSI